MLLGIRGVDEGEARVGRKRSLIAQLAEGFGTVVGDAGTRTVFILAGAQTLVYGALTVLVAVLALDLLDLGPEGVGFLNAAIGAGGLVGSVFTFGLVGQNRLASAFGLGIFFWGCRSRSSASGPS